MEDLLIGILLDVSGSMQNASTEGANSKDTEWARSIFTVIDNLIEKDLKPNNHVFAIGFGASREIDPSVFDLLASLETEDPGKSLRNILSEIISILKENGAYNVNKWAPIEDLIDVLRGQEYNCNLVLNKLQRDSSFVSYVVNECLPPVCRDFKGDDPITGVVNLFYRAGCSAVTNFVTATREDIDAVAEKVKKMLPFLKPVSDESVLRAHAAHSILRGHVRDESELTKQRIDELMDKVRPCIYGGTPLHEALVKSNQMFSQSIFRNHKKLLFVLSDGQPSDETGNTLRVIPSNITKVSCFITSSRMVKPHVLYSSVTDTQQWESDAKFMFHLSSTMLTKDIPRTIFVQSKPGKKWTVEMINNETQLFLEVNHPDHIKDACDFAREVVTSQEALSDVLASVDLDVYIKRSNDGFAARDQEEEPTCYAHASATVMHLAMNRILGREGGCPDFESLRDEMIQCYSQQPGREQGADTKVVLQEMCPRYRLRCKKVDKREAMVAIMEKRPVIARFRLTQKEWSNFRRFFAYNEVGVLKSNDVEINKRQRNEKTRGHAVILTSFNSKCLRFMNSWGTEWADGGFFNVQDANVLDFEFFDVYWDEQDLKPQEKDHYAKHGSQVANKLMENLLGLQESTFQCPLCKRTSNVTEFTGRLSSVKCPRCWNTFHCGTRGNILALNLYLTSLSDKNLQIRYAAIGNQAHKPNECKTS